MTSTPKKLPLLSMLCNKVTKLSRSFCAQREFFRFFYPMPKGPLLCNFVTNFFACKTFAFALILCIKVINFACRQSKGTTFINFIDKSKGSCEPLWHNFAPLLCSEASPATLYFAYPLPIFCLSAKQTLTLAFAQEQKWALAITFINEIDKSKGSCGGKAKGEAIFTLPIGLCFYL
jgi:hypothetical protein